MCANDKINSLYFSTNDKISRLETWLCPEKVKTTRLEGFSQDFGGGKKRVEEEEVKILNYERRVGWGVGYCSLL